MTTGEGKGLTSRVPLFIQEGHASAWRSWFAWRPVWVRSPEFPYDREHRVWLRRIERRRFYPAPWFLLGVIADTSWPEYRETAGRRALSEQAP